MIIHHKECEIWEKLFFENRITATTNKCNPDFVKLADAFGIKSVECTEKKDLNKHIQDFLNYDNTILLRIKCINDICLPLIRSGYSLNDMLLMNNYEDVITKRIYFKYMLNIFLFFLFCLFVSI